ncbi:MAG TPA: AhpC/TSA family protein [Pyrinomonadaceae bacterium]|jgi:peroxiredoxin|nr:AhpC/TSA family protein [Pyrinomonadaceae bacterium]
MRLKKGKISSGDKILPKKLKDVFNNEIDLPDWNNFLHLQFRRFAGCPVCNLHLKQFANRINELANAKISEVIVFHSTATELFKHTRGLPFAVIADPEKKLYAEFGVGTSIWSIFNPLAVPGIVRAVVLGTFDLLSGKAFLPKLMPTGGRFGLPADFLIAPTGLVVASKYGTHADDHWSVDEVLGKVRQFQKVT